MKSAAVAACGFCAGWMACFVMALIGSKFAPTHRKLIAQFGPGDDMHDVWPTDNQTRRRHDG